MTASTNPLTFQIAKTAQELAAVFELRRKIFSEEVVKSAASSFSDQDEFDADCDHLIVCDASANNLVVGTYRILRREIAKKKQGFYAEKEFEIKGIYDIRAEIAEIGRSCVHPKYRDGRAIRQLWHGLMQYMLDYRIKYLCGSGSVESRDPQTLAFVWQYLIDQDACINEEVIGFRVRPREGHRLDDWQKITQTSLSSEEKKKNRKRIPPLIKGYARAQAKFFPEPAFDPSFGTTDFFIAFDILDVEKRYGKHFIDSK